MTTEHGAIAPFYFTDDALERLSAQGIIVEDAAKGTGARMFRVRDGDTVRILSDQEIRAAAEKGRTR